MSYDDLREHGSETAVKAAGRLRQQGKPYESESLLVTLQKHFTDSLQVVDGDIAYWKAGA